MTLGDNVLCKNWYLLGEKKNQATSTKQDLRAPYGSFSKFPTTTPLFFIWESPPPGRRQVFVIALFSTPSPNFPNAPLYSPNGNHVLDYRQTEALKRRVHNRDEHAIYWFPAKSALFRLASFQLRRELETAYRHNDVSIS